MTVDKLVATNFALAQIENDYFLVLYVSLLISSIDYMTCFLTRRGANQGVRCPRTRKRQHHMCAAVTIYGIMVWMWQLIIL